MPEFDSTVQYREVEGYPGYRVGSDGSVWCCRGIGHHRGRLLPSWRRMTPGVTPSGHLYISLRPGRKFALVHRLILAALVGPCPKGMVCRHFPDRDPTNNALGNIQWGTNAENHRDQVIHGTDSSGERNPAAVLTEAKVRAIRSLYATGKFSQEAIGRRFGVGQDTISDIVRRETWSKVS